MIDRRVILVHGAGSFGHMKSKRYRLAEGRIIDMQQDSAVLEVRNDMMVLNSIIKQSLEKYGIKSETFLQENGFVALVLNFQVNYHYQKM